MVTASATTATATATTTSAATILNEAEADDAKKQSAQSEHELYRFILMACSRLCSLRDLCHYSCTISQCA